MPMIEDKELRIGLKKGSQLCFTHIYRLYAHKAFLLSFKYLRNKELAEDAVQNAFIKLWNIRETIDETRPINHLLFHILRNDLLNTLRKLKHRAIFVEQCFETLPLADENNEEWYNEAASVGQHRQVSVFPIAQTNQSHHWRFYAVCYCCQYPFVAFSRAVLTLFSYVNAG